MFSDFMIAAGAIILLVAAFVEAADRISRSEIRRGR